MLKFLTYELRKSRIRNLGTRELRTRKLRNRKFGVHDTDAIVKPKTTPNIKLNDVLWESTNCLHLFVKSTCNKDTSSTNEETIRQPTAKIQDDATFQNKRFDKTLGALYRATKSMNMF